MIISRITQKQKPTRNLTQRSVNYVLSHLSLRQSSGRKRRFFIAGVLTTFGLVSPHAYQTVFQVRNTFDSTRSTTLADATTEASLFREVPYLLETISLASVVYLFKETLLSRNTRRALPLYMPYSYNIRGSPSLAT